MDTVQVFQSHGHRTHGPSHVALNQCPMVRFNRRTTRWPRYFVMSNAVVPRLVVRPYFPRDAGGKESKFVRQLGNRDGLFSFEQILVNKSTAFERALGARLPSPE